MFKKRKISVLGVTGSVGKTILDVVGKYPACFKVEAVAAHSNVAALKKVILKYRPKIAVLWDEAAAERLKKELAGKRVKICSGMNGLLEAVLIDSADMVIFSMSGMDGLIPLFEAIRAKKDISIANKELIVSAGKLIMREVKKRGVNFIPIDSEHSAIFQCICGRDKSEIRNIILTASGGPFLNRDIETFAEITPKDALKHPKWKMGKKITVDSATMMNKGLEVIEASYLYGLSRDRIKVIIHPESLIHSFVEFIDGSLLAQISSTSMFFPVCYAMAYPYRLENNKEKFNLANTSFTFRNPDYNKFPLLKLAYRALETGKTMPAVLNAANEEAVNMFLNGIIGFNEIKKIVNAVMDRHDVLKLTVKNILNVDRWAREEAKKLCRI